MRFIDPDGMAPLDIWRFDTETKELTLVKETKDKFDTFINQDGKVITRTNDTEKDSQKNIDNYGGVAKAKNWFEDLGELGKALKSDEVSRSTMESRAEKNGYETTGLERLEKMGERKVWSDRIGVVRDFLAGKAVPGESAFATAMDITEAPKTYSNLRGNPLHKDVQSVSDFIKKIPASVKEAYENMMYELKRGFNSYQNGNYRGL